MKKSIYYVTGGIYSDTSFTELSRDAVRQGPFSSKAEAMDAWRGLSVRYADDALARFEIEVDQGAESHQSWWVIGGTYEDTSFSTMGIGQQEQRIGPFFDHAEAVEAWRGLALSTVDEACTRFRIEQEGT